MKRHLRLGLAAAIAAAAAAPASAEAAPVWQELASGTSAEITAIEYQSDGRFWFTTANGEIFKRGGDGTFTRVHGPSAVRLNDIEFQDGGNVGLAVGNGGQVLRSANAGDTWADVNPDGTPIPVSRRGTTFFDCSAQEPLGDVNSVRFAGSGRAWIFAEGSQMAKSVTGDPATVGAAGTWVDAMRDTSDDSCRISGSLYGEGLADAFFVPSNPDVGYIVTSSFSAVFFTADGLTSDGQQKPQGAGNSGGGRRTIVGDPANPSRMWSVLPEPYGVSTTGTTDDGWDTSQRFEIANTSRREFPANGPYDVDFNGGTLLSAGDAGMILNSVDGRNFYYVDAGGALATHNWRAASLASATQGAVGGVGGKLAITAQANSIPDIVPPTGTISGPGETTAGQATTFTAVLADEAGGSGIDPASIQWTAEGLPGTSGATATFTWPATGFYTVRVSFRDLAGNSGAASKSVSVGAASPPSLPTFLLGQNASANRPPLVGRAARIKGRYVTLRVKGKYGLPPGYTKAQACNGQMFISVVKKKRLLTARKTKLRRDCTYRKRIRIARRRVGKVKRLTLVVAFGGNQYLASISKKYRVKVKR